MTPAFRDIYNKFGVKGFWRGCTGSIPRLVVASAVQLPTFDQSLRKPRKYRKFLERLKCLVFSDVDFYDFQN
jgi:hypothetical protein